MVRGMKTGRRDFQPGNPGRPKGSKNKVPGSLKATVVVILAELAAEDREQWKQTIRDAIREGGRVAFPYIQLAAYYLDGKPVDRVNIQGTQPIHIIFPKDMNPDNDENRSAADSSAA